MQFPWYRISYHASVATYCNRCTWKATSPEYIHSVINISFYHKKQRTIQDSGHVSESSARIQNTENGLGLWRNRLTLFLLRFPFIYKFHLHCSPPYHQWWFRRLQHVHPSVPDTLMIIRHRHQLLHKYIQYMFYILYMVFILFHHQGEWWTQLPSPRPVWTLILTKASNLQGRR